MPRWGGVAGAGSRPCPWGYPPPREPGLSRPSVGRRGPLRGRFPNSCESSLHSHAFVGNAQAPSPRVDIRAPVLKTFTARAERRRQASPLAYPDECKALGTPLLRSARRAGWQTDFELCEWSQLQRSQALAAARPGTHPLADPECALTCLRSDEDRTLREGRLRRVAQREAGHVALRVCSQVAHQRVRRRRSSSPSTGCTSTSSDAVG